ncbi:MAG: hypothetical protein GXP56_08210 [Deltaproteobacteria bacterium]|nr:hypothetical protein [Deltaproteobacteria bacterium]
MSKKKRKKKLSGRKNPAVKTGKSKLPLIIVAVFLLIAGGFFYYDFTNKGNASEKSKVKQAIALSDPSILRGGEKRPTLSPARFTGNVARAYEIARENPELLDSMYCYCNCKETFGHKSLLTCYVDTHAENCGICMDQAFYAVSKYRSGMDIISVRKAVDAKFWRPLR